MALKEDDNASISSLTRLMEEDEEDYAQPNGKYCCRVLLPLTKGSPQI